MLGWEFPPVINGGLGVACHDLSSAMSAISDITMVVPKTSPGFKVNNVNLVGVNNIDVSMLGGISTEFYNSLPFKYLSVPADLNPYYSESDVMPDDGLTESSSRLMRAPGSFNIDNLYGGDVISKVIQFADITARMAKNMEFDVIHAHDWMTMIAGLQIRHQTGKPLVMHIHSLEVDRSGPDSKGWVYDLEKYGMEKADLLMPVSNFTAGNIERHYGISKDKMAVVHNGSTPVSAYKSRKPFAEKTVLFVGRITRQKGPEKFLDIATRVLEKDPNVRFIMAGVGDNFKSVLEKSSYNSVGHRFHLTGFLDQKKLQYLFSVSDVYCMPSISEPFGLSAIEAAQFGIPCVISKQSGVGEVLNGALKFDFWDDNRAAGYILNLLHDKVLRKKVVADATENLKNISWDLSARKILNEYSNRKFI
jgi:glycogen synthase